MEQQVVDVDWECLSSLPEKRRLYSRDPHFRESMWDARQALGDEPFAVLHRVALLALKPESLAGRRVDSLLRFLDDHGFTPIHVESFAYTRHINRELWRYQWNAATIEKMDLTDRINLALPTAILLLRDDGRPRELPTSVRLKALKGAALPERRDPGSMRAALEAPNRMLTFVHTADEPADVARELGILFDRPERRAIFEALEAKPSGDVTEQCRHLLEGLEARAPVADFDPERAWRRVTRSARRGVAAALQRERDHYLESGVLDWWPFLSLAEKAGTDPWDVVAICAAVVEHQDVGYEPLIEFGAGVVDGWLTGRARLCSG